MAERHRQRVWVALLAVSVMTVGCTNAQDTRRAAGGREASAVTRSVPSDSQTSGSSSVSSPLEHDGGAPSSSDSQSSAARSGPGGSQESPPVDEAASGRRGTPVTLTSRRAPGAPVGEVGRSGQRTGTPIAVLPFDNIGGPLSAFNDAVAFRIEHDCGGDDGCFTVAIAYVDAGDQEPCTVLSIAPNPPSVHGETVTATVSRCETEASDTEAGEGTASVELPQDNDARKPSGGGSGGEGSNGSSLGGGGGGRHSGGSSSGGGDGEGSREASPGGDGAGSPSGEQSSSGDTTVDGAEPPASPEGGSE